MHNPSAALAWEFWRRHRARLIGLATVLLAFAFVYPVLCARASFNQANPDPLNEFATKLAMSPHQSPTPGRVVELLYLMFLAFGPAMTMIVTLLCMIWMLTMTEFDLRTKDPMRFPKRLFNLPVSTPFLFWYFVLGGTAAIAALYGVWHFIAPSSLVDLFGLHHTCLAWLTLVAVAQAITWGLASWPNLRFILLTAALFGWPSICEEPLLLALLLIAGLVFANIGLNKMRHGQWQGWAWGWPFSTPFSRAARTPVKPFASARGAQLWFEWRRFTRLMCFMTVALAIVPVCCLLLENAFGLWPPSKEGMNVLVSLLIGSPLLIHFCLGASPSQPDQPFLMVRPLTNGEIVMAMMKTAAISTLLSWAAVLAALGALTFLSAGRAALKDMLAHPAYTTAAVIGLVFVTWRLAVINLFFVLPGHRRSASIPACLLVCFSAIPLLNLLKDTAYWEPFLRLVPVLLAMAVAVKMFLAALAFRAGLRRRLLAPSILAGYLAVWGALIVLLLAVALFIRFDNLLDVPRLWIVLGIVLVVPLARIGLCPIALDRYRHG